MTESIKENLVGGELWAELELCGVAWHVAFQSDAGDIPLLEVTLICKYSTGRMGRGGENKYLPFCS